MDSSRDELKGDVCVLGGGIAGMLVAEKLLARGASVLMVERGEETTFAERLERQSHSSRLAFNSDAHESAHEPAPFGPTHRSDRYLFHPVYNLGGSTNHYYGNTPRIHREHFSRRALRPGGVDRRWPIGYDELEPYYMAAERRLAVSGNPDRTPFPGRFDYPLPAHRPSPSDLAAAGLFGADDVLPVPTVRPSRQVGERPRCCGSNSCWLCPVDSKGTALNTVYPAIRDRLRLRSGLLATEIQCVRGAVRAVTGVDAEGRAHELRADHYVVACNGVDSPLLLLRSPTVPQHPALGHYYMDHPALDLVVWLDGVDASPGYGDSAQTGMVTTFFRQVREDLPVSVFGDVLSATLGEDGAVRDRLLRLVLARAVAAGRAPGGSLRERVAAIFRQTLHLSFQVETEPLYENTVAVGRITRSGQARPQVTLRYPSYLRDCYDTIISFIRSRRPDAAIVHRATAAGVSHWLGATRMAESAADGCVDPDLRYHGLANLSILSASTFPSGSSVGPTLTLAALALRLGDHLGAGRR